VSTTQIVLTIIGAVLGSNALSVGITLYFTRRRTEAETQKTGAEAQKAEAEASGLYVDQIKALVSDLRVGLKEVDQTHNALNECLKLKAGVEIRVKEVEADNAHLERALKLANEEREVKERELSDARARLRQHESEG
jgi:hypothetical protein